MRKGYQARWLDPQNMHTIGSVSFFARGLSEAIRKAERIGHEIGLPNCPRQISEGATLVHQKQGGAK